MINCIKAAEVGSGAAVHCVVRPSHWQWPRSHWPGSAECSQGASPCDMSRVTCDVWQLVMPGCNELGLCWLICPGGVEPRWAEWWTSDTQQILITSLICTYINTLEMIFKSLLGKCHFILLKRYFNHFGKPFHSYFNWMMHASCMNTKHWMKCMIWVTVFPGVMC